MKSSKVRPVVLFGLAALLAAGCDSFDGPTFPPPPEGSYTVKGQQLAVGNAAPIAIDTADVSAEFFKAVQVRAALGRLFTPDEYGGKTTPVAVLSNDLWKEKFDGSPAVVGQPITLDGRKVVIVGIAEPYFSGPAGARLWQPR